jgi:hypothetical protein
MPSTIITYTTPIAFEGDYEKRLFTTVTAVSEQVVADQRAVPPPVELP